MKRDPEKNRAQWARHADKVNAKRREKWQAQKDEKNAARAAKYREGRPDLPPYKPMLPRGPMSPPEDPYVIADGQELSGLSTLVGPTGETRLAWHKTRAAGADPLPLPEGFSSVPTRVSRMSRGDGQQIVEWASYAPDEEERIRAITEAWKRHASLYAGLAGKSPVPECVFDADQINVIPIGDPHIGMLAWAPETGDHFDTKIACRELRCCIQELLASMPKCERAIITNLGDAMHAQDDSNKTPGHGHMLDVDGRFARSLDALHILLRSIVDEALKTHEHVTFRNLPGNHDPRVAVELMMWLRAVYENEPRVDIADAYAAHQYDLFGTNLLGWHHGDRTRKGELPAIMASDHDGGGTGWWGTTTEHVWHVGHEHHTTVLETPSCFTWVHNTMAARDAYHAGRYRAKRMLRGFTYHKEYGESGIKTVSLARVRAALEKGPI